MRKKLLLIFLAAVLICSAAVPSAAWLAQYIQVRFPPIAGSAEVSYFESGDGSKETPYVISNRIHLYNLAWLQYIGYFNKGAINNTRDQSYFVLKNNIDMEGLTIPPIGTTEYPFIGNFDGQGFVVSDVKTANADKAFSAKPSQAGFNVVTANGNLLTKYSVKNADEVGHVMGFFGVVGPYAGEATESNVDLSVIAVKSFGIADYTLTSSSKATTVGFVAGYVNATVENVLVGDCTLVTEQATGGAQETAVISRHTLVGYCTEDHEKSVNETVFSVTDPAVAEQKDINNITGEDNNWGGSVAMDELFQNLAEVRGSLGNPGSGIGIGDYAYKATKVMSADGKSYYAVDRSTENAGYMYTNKENDKSQYSVVYTYDDQENLDEFVWLAGGAMVTTITCTEDTSKTVTANYIKYGDQFLNVDLGGGEPSIGLGTDEAAASRWVIEGGSLFVLTQGCKLYVHVDEYQSISFHYTPSNTGSWSYDAGTGNEAAKGLCYTSGAENYYLKLLDGNWKLQAAADASAYYVIKHGNNYMVAYEPVTGVYAATNLETTDENDPAIAHWYLTPYGEHNGAALYNVWTTVNSVNLYLSSYGLQLNAMNMNEFRWVLTAEGFLQIHPEYDIYGSGGHYLVFENGSWSMSASSKNAVALTAVATDTQDTLAWTKGDDESVKDMLFTPAAPEGEYNFELGVANENDATYIPLQMNGESHAPTARNTGYITSGMYNRLNSQPEYGPQSPQFNTGDVRLSNFYRDNIGHPDVVHAYVYNDSTGAMEYTEISVNGTHEDLVKFSDSVKDYNVLLESERLYGLQFIDGKISKNSLITIPNATINGLVANGTITVPADCIDFTLKQEGYINFFAGTYYPETSCFFSLHHVIRDGDNVITDIKEIGEIYTHTDPSITEKYVYKYTNNGGYSVGTAAPIGAVKVFDTAWLTNPELPEDHVQGKADMTTDSIKGFKGEVFYFEIPVNKGEYALGAVEEEVGATLLYLDIGSTLQEMEQHDIDRTTIFEMFTEDVRSYTCANGVGVLKSVPDGSGGYTSAYAQVNGEYVSLTLGKDYGTNLSVLRADDGITVSSTASATASLNAAAAVTVTAGNNVTLVNASGSERTVTKRVTYIDFNKTNNTTITTIVTLVWTETDGDSVLDGNEAYAVTITDGEGTALTGTGIATTNGVTTFELLHHAEQETITWTDVGMGTTILSYQYSPAAGVAVTNTPVFTLTAGTLTGTYRVTASATAASTVTVTKNTAGATATGSTVVSGNNVTVSG